MEEERNKRRYLHAVRPSDSRYKPRGTIEVETSSRGLKRKHNDEDTSGYDKRTRNEINDFKPKSSASPKKNLANQRLQSLRRSLSEGRPFKPSTLVNDKGVSTKTIKRRSIQDRLKIKRDISKIQNDSQLNRSLPTVLNSNETKSKSSSSIFHRNVEIINKCTSGIASPDISSFQEKTVEMVNKCVSVEMVNCDEEMEIDWVSTNKSEEESALKEAESFLSGPVHIVVDTNIFISHLSFISKLKDMIFKGKYVFALYS